MRHQSRIITGQEEDYEFEATHEFPSCLLSCSFCRTRREHYVYTVDCGQNTCTWDESWKMIVRRENVSNHFICVWCRIEERTCVVFLSHVKKDKNFELVLKRTKRNVSSKQGFKNFTVLHSSILTLFPHGLCFKRIPRNDLEGCCCGAAESPTVVVLEVLLEKLSWTRRTKQHSRAYLLNRKLKPFGQDISLIEEYPKRGHKRVQEREDPGQDILVTFMSAVCLSCSSDTGIYLLDVPLLFWCKNSHLVLLPQDEEEGGFNEGTSSVTLKRPKKWEDAKEIQKQICRQLRQQSEQDLLSKKRRRRVEDEHQQHSLQDFNTCRDDTQNRSTVE